MDKKFIDYYELLKNDVLRLSYSYTHNLADAEDITQEVFIKLYENITKLDETFIKKWCLKVTANKCKNFFFTAWYRKISYLSNYEENNLPSLEVENDDLWKAIFNLPKNYRLIIMLYYYEGYKIKEIKDILKLKESTIKVRLLRARRKLAKYLKEDSYEER